MRRLLAALLLIVAVPAPGAETPAPEPEPPAARSVAGSFLVATRDMPDPRFAGTVIYMVRHTAEGAMGLIVNRVLAERTLGEVLRSVGDADARSSRPLRVYDGGPVAPDAGFVLHSPEYAVDGTIPAGEIAALSTRAEVLQAIAAGRGPQRFLFALGYSGWGPGQLERELAQGGWTVVPADRELLFDAAPESKWERALARRGVDL